MAEKTQQVEQPALTLRAVIIGAVGSAVLTASPLFIALRMGMAGKKVDNASSGGITCGVNLDGHCKEAGYYSYVNGGKRLLNHPTSDMPFKDIFIPNMDKIIAFVEKAAVRIPHFRLVSWDIALREDGEPVLIEANFYDGEIDFHQLNNGPLFKEDTEAILREVFSK